MIALDASALIALLFREPGFESVARVAGTSCLSTVNLVEVLERMGRGGHPVANILNRVESLGVQCVPFSVEHAALAASIAPVARRIGLSLGDCACLAFAMEREIPVLTADRVWALVDLGVEVRLIR